MAMLLMHHIGKILPVSISVIVGYKNYYAIVAVIICDNGHTLQCVCLTLLVTLLCTLCTVIMDPSLGNPDLEIKCQVLASVQTEV